MQPMNQRNSFIPVQNNHQMDNTMFHKQTSVPHQNDNQNLVNHDPNMYGPRNGDPQDRRRGNQMGPDGTGGPPGQPVPGQQGIGAQGPQGYGMNMGGGPGGPIQNQNNVNNVNMQQQVPQSQNPNSQEGILAAQNQQQAQMLNQQQYAQMQRLKEKQLQQNSMQQNNMQNVNQQNVNQQPRSHGSHREKDLSHKSNKPTLDDAVVWIKDLRSPDPHKKSDALKNLSRHRDQIDNLAIYLWESTFTITLILQEIFKFYEILQTKCETPNHTKEGIHMLNNAISLIKCCADHDVTRKELIESRIPIYLYPYLNVKDDANSSSAYDDRLQGDRAIRGLGGVENFFLKKNRKKYFLKKKIPDPLFPQKRIQRDPLPHPHAHLQPSPSRIRRC